MHALLLIVGLLLLACGAYLHVQVTRLETQRQLAREFENMAEAARLTRVLWAYQGVFYLVMLHACVLLYLHHTGA